MFPELIRDDVFRLETRRLWLRWPRAADVDAFVDLASDPSVALWTARIPHPYTRAAAQDFVLRARAANGEGQGLALALALRGRPQQAIGGVELTPDGSGAARLGYWLGQPYRKQGYMAEAIEALTSMVYGLTELAAIEAEARPDNEASLGVLARLGFVEAGRRSVEAPARGASFDCLVMRLERRAFLSGPAPAAPKPAPARPLPSMSQQRRQSDPHMTRALAMAADQ